MRKVFGIITSDATRVGTSSNGNPTYDIYVNEVPYRTETDGSIGYAADNYREGAEVEVHLTKAGRVFDINQLS